MMVQDRYFYDPVAGNYTVGPVRGRSGEAVRGNRLGADLADPSEYGDRQPESA
jgi:hypothetical protein